MTDQSDGAFGSTGAGHTPGPWSIITGDDSPIEMSIDGSDADSAQVVSQWVIVESETHAGFLAAVIDMNYPNSYNDDQLDANARLIAAAPNYAAVAPDAAYLLEQYAQFIRDDVKADDLERHPYLPLIEATAADLRATIALATGAAA